MRKVVTVGLLSALLATVVVASATGTLPKPKPWQWTPQKAAAKLTASRAIEGGEIGSTILSARCTPKGRGVAGRFSRFTCATRWGGSNGSDTSLLTIRVPAVGTGKDFCVVTITFPTLPGKFFAWQASGKAGPRIRPVFACPTA